MNKTVQWLYEAENNSGGISAWRYQDTRYADPYPEITGYSLPTMWRNGANDLAIRCANWLVSIQNKDGSYNGIDRVPRPFDTAAIIEGLLFTFGWADNERYLEAAKKALDWTRTQISNEGYLYNSPREKKDEAYNLRASAIINNRQELAYWRGHGLIHGGLRTHYLAYALEGALNLGDTELAEYHLKELYANHKGLMPFVVGERWEDLNAGADVCSTIQMAILFHRMGWDVSNYYDALLPYIHENGGVPQSPSDRREIAWAAKFWLDLQEELK